MNTITAVIGLSSLIPALGLTPNYKLSSEKTTYGSSETAFKNPVTYINEKNRYGASRPLRKNALLLLLYLHFQAPDKNGFVRFSVSEAAGSLCCHERSIHNNLRLLSQKQFISCQEDICSDLYQVFLHDYKNYFLPADKGGRGYIILSDDLFCELQIQKRINQIRLILRSYINEMKPRDHRYDEELFTFHSLKRYVPHYSTIQEIKDLLHSDSYTKIFTVQKVGSVAMKNSIKEAFHAGNLRAQLKRDCATALEELVCILQPENDSRYRRHFYLSRQQCEDISSLAYLYPVPLILESLREIYHQYYEKFNDPQNLGALVRTYVQKKALVFSAS